MVRQSRDKCATGCVQNVIPRCRVEGVSDVGDSPAFNPAIELEDTVDLGAANQNRGRFPVTNR